jgi:hypothetical protein
LLQSVLLPVTTSAHSITVDPFNGDVFVALAGTGAVNPCPESFANAGCIAVYSTPEPSSLAILAIAMFSLAGASAWIRRRRS